MKVMIIACFSIFFFIVGMIDLFFPEKIRKLKDDQEGKRTSPFLNPKFRKRYVFSFRIGGIIAVLVSLFLVWVGFHVM